MKIHRSQPACREHQLGREGLAEDASAGYGASANLPQVPQVHQSCVRTDFSTVRHQKLGASDQSNRKHRVLVICETEMQSPCLLSASP
jgi:hypothetical protein